MGKRTLADLLLERVAEGARPRDPDDLEEQLNALVARAQAAWPELAIPAGEFVCYVAERLAEDEPCDRALGELQAADLYLACACSRGLPRALEIFEAQYVPEIRRAIERARLPGVSLEDAVQSLRERLLMGRGSSPPRLSAYRGTGALRNWVRVVAARHALTMLRRRSKETPTPARELAELIERDPDPELGYLKELYRDVFQRAFAQAVGSLGMRDRDLLLHHYLDGLSLERLAEIHGVHRATVARWIAKTREQVISATQVALRERSPLTTGEFQSVIRLFRSRFDLSVRRLFEAAREEDEA